MFASENVREQTNYSKLRCVKGLDWSAAFKKIKVNVTLCTKQA